MASWLGKLRLSLWFAALLPLASYTVQAQDGVPAELKEVDHIGQPTDQFFTAGQPTEDQVALFAENGVEHIINLRSLKEMADVPEASWATRQQIAFYHIPISGPDDLNRENVRLFHEILTRIGDDKALLHCASSNRVGAMMALRAAWHEGASSEEALAKGKKFGMTSLATAVSAKLQQ